MNTSIATPSASALHVSPTRRAARYTAITLRVILVAPAVVMAVCAFALTLLIESVLSSEPV